MDSQRLCHEPPNLKNVNFLKQEESESSGTIFASFDSCSVLMRTVCAMSFNPNADINSWRRLRVDGPSREQASRTLLSTMVGPQFIGNRAYIKKSSTDSSLINNDSMRPVSTDPKTRSDDESTASNAEPCIFLDLLTFKTRRCDIKTEHNTKQCLHFHEASKKDRRRNPTTYTSELCPHVQGGRKSCPNGDSCPKAHNRVEDFYHPEKYKSKFC